MNSNANNFAIGTRLYVTAFYGENGDKFHATTATVAQGDNGAEIRCSASFVCDGEYMHRGNGGLYRGYGNVIAVQGSSEERAALDAAVTCEACRKNLNLAPLAKSEAGTATLTAKKVADKTAKATAANAKKVAELRDLIATTEARVAELEAYNATPDAELIAAYVDAFCAEFQYDDATKARMMQDPREAASVADRKASNLNTIKYNRKNLKDLAKRLTALEA